MVTTTSGQMYAAFRPYDGVDYAFHDSPSTTPDKATFFLKVMERIDESSYRKSKRFIEICVSGLESVRT